MTDCNCCRPKREDVISEPYTELLMKGSKSSQKVKKNRKAIDTRQEPSPPSRKVNVPNPYNEKEAKRLYSTEKERMQTGDIILFDIKGIISSAKVMIFTIERESSLRLGLTTWE